MAPLPAAAVILAAAPAMALPGWWTAFLNQPAFQSRFTQESESAVFGTLRRQGSLAVARGGRMRAAYVQGLLLVADGRDLVQYDPDTRTAQRWDLRAARTEAPLLALLLDPGSVAAHYLAQPLDSRRLRLAPRRKDLPEVELEGRGATPTVLRWTDPSGAKQVLRLEAVATGPVDPAAFRFDPPAGTRWIGAR